MPVPEEAHALVTLVRGTLGDAVLGVYLHGSAVLGGLRPHSDLDLLVVARQSLTEQQRRALLAALLPLSGRDGHRPVELIVVVQSEIRPWRYPPTCDFLYGDWLRGDFDRGVLPSPAPSPDLAPLLTMTLLGDTPLYGPPPAEVLDPVPYEDLVRGITAGVAELMGDLESDTRNVLLTLARIWTTLATGTVRSKDAAAAWVLARLPQAHRPVLERARAGYTGETEEGWDDLRGRVRPAAEFLVRAVTEARTASDGPAQEGSDGPAQEGSYGPPRAQP
ncbi:aminoglycoside adenylyltransferase family protein [Streptomyces aurantiogriseus]|uniref:Nucleotidyltransferase n=1 Tax=Streptomyces aurantiogriseus TaxID=66870 RepID=A0A918FK04_9ACTN|nr:aminoglycoside adenylyltransferase family protein [Streptomyces aurantiogriseus]GGR45380.1 nucleotidyltransferase [Streptomyces aurantiogriseus]